ncbi:GrpB family protein [Saccharomonospora iraqiensis]|uniref:GrpB family protein n=1 Tax=Saccharomonospora iraqiensis TaxID=52698 RepID=UPI00022E537D|nr:GrpB family protein [Saccharomonospora iraqiensis]
MEGAVPAWAHEPPEIRSPDPGWRESARAESVRLAVVLGPWLVDGVEHIGSTAVPDLPAKPVVDLMASVGDPDVVAREAAAELAADGWCAVPPERDGRPWRRFFVKPDASGVHRVAHLHLLPAGHPRWYAQLAFRDTLRRDPGLTARYAALKRCLATRHAGDREAYTRAKSDFVAEVLGRSDRSGP